MKVSARNTIELEPGELWQLLRYALEDGHYDISDGLRAAIENMPEEMPPEATVSNVKTSTAAQYTEKVEVLRLQWRDEEETSAGPYR